MTKSTCRSGVCLPLMAALMVSCGSRDDDSPKVFVPLDDRPVQTAAEPPRPISGGTLTITSDGRWAVAADPDRDVVWLADVEGRRLVHTVTLLAGDEPGRVIEGSAGRAHVVLRRGGAVASIDLETGVAVSRVDVCGAPRGIAYDAANGLIHVACAGGQLVSMTELDGSITRRLHLDVDLRDVLVMGDVLRVSRFKTAEVLEMDAVGEVARRIRPRSLLHQIPPVEFFDESTGEVGVRPERTSSLDPAVGWRMVPMGLGWSALLHQYARSGVIGIEPVDRTDPPVQTPEPPSDDSEYGVSGGSSVENPSEVSCGSVVQSTVSAVGPNGEVRAGMPLMHGVLTVDAAVSPDRRWVAVVHAGNAGSPGALSVYELTPLLESAVAGVADNCAETGFRTNLEGQSTAVAFSPGTDDAARRGAPWMIVQTREPAALHFLDDPVGVKKDILSLETRSVFDTGHEIFHRNTGAGIACVSCHVEGGEDGRVWRFDPIGDRRTQSLNVGLEGTAPFHWDGDMKNLETLMDEVFVGRMGGLRQSPERLNALAGWIFSLTPPAPIVAPDDPSALRGRAVFESSEVGCVSCHTGPKHTRAGSFNVGTTPPTHLLQVPSLVGVGYRAPFIHTGCAPTLEARFDPECGGGDEHGRTSHLTAREIEDLTSYLRSL